MREQSKVIKPTTGPKKLIYPLWGGLKENKEERLKGPSLLNDFKFFIWSWPNEKDTQQQGIPLRSPRALAIPLGDFCSPWFPECWWWVVFFGGGGWFSGKFKFPLLCSSPSSTFLLPGKQKFLKTRGKVRGLHRPGQEPPRASCQEVSVSWLLPQETQIKSPFLWRAFFPLWKGCVQSPDVLWKISFNLF